MALTTKDPEKPKIKENNHNRKIESGTTERYSEKVKSNQGSLIDITPWSSTRDRKWTRSLHLSLELGLGKEVNERGPLSGNTPKTEARE